MRVAWHPSYNHPLPPAHRFPMEQYDLIIRQLLYEGVVDQNQIFTPEPATDDIIQLVHSPEYLSRLKRLDFTRQEERATGFPMSPSLVEREILIVGGTVKCAEHALEDGIAFNTAGGTHHAFSDRGEGFCLLNDIAVSSAWALNRNLVNQVLVIDLDVHQGNGTAHIFRNEPKVFTFSMHGAGNYPLRKSPGDLDVGLPDGIGDHEYLDILSGKLDLLFRTVKPELVQYQCGVDILKTDKLGRLGITMEGCRKRDELVLRACKDNDVPVVCTMGGGYSENIRDIVNAHANTYRIATHLFN